VRLGVALVKLLNEDKEVAEPSLLKHPHQSCSNKRQINSQDINKLKG
jgi:hypothetical protein